MTARIARLWLSLGRYVFTALEAALTAWMASHDRSAIAVGVGIAVTSATFMFALCAGYIRAMREYVRERDAEIAWMRGREQRAAQSLQALMNAQPKRGALHVN